MLRNCPELRGSGGARYLHCDAAAITQQGRISPNQHDESTAANGVNVTLTICGYSVGGASSATAGFDLVSVFHGIKSIQCPSCPGVGVEPERRPADEQTASGQNRLSPTRTVLVGRGGM